MIYPLQDNAILIIAFSPGNHSFAALFFPSWAVLQAFHLSSSIFPAGVVKITNKR